MKTFLRLFNKVYLPFLVFSAVAVVASIVFIITFPFHVGEIRKITVLNQVQSGGTLSYNVDYCRNVSKEIPTETRRFLVPVDSKDNLQPIELSSRPSIESTRSEPGCRTTKTPIKIAVDAATPPGEYRLLLEVRYCIFPSRCIPVNGESGKFLVEKPNVATQLNTIRELLGNVYNQTGLEPPVANVAPQAVTPGRQQSLEEVIEAESGQRIERGSQPSPQPTQTQSDQTVGPQESLIERSLNDVTRAVDGLIFKNLLNKEQRNVDR